MESKIVWLNFLDNIATLSNLYFSIIAQKPNFLSNSFEFNILLDISLKHLMLVIFSLFFILEKNTFVYI